jgi:hypothetical protein
MFAEEPSGGPTKIAARASGSDLVLWLFYGLFYTTDPTVMNSYDNYVSYFRSNVNFSQISDVITMFLSQMHVYTAKQLN